jgi:hypothetical protein
MSVYYLKFQFTYEGEPLAEIMDKIADKESNGPSISHKEDNATLAAYFKEVLPDYDEEEYIHQILKK